MATQTKKQDQTAVEAAALSTLILTGSVKIGGEYHAAKSKIDTDDKELHAALLASGAAKKFRVIEKDEVVVEEETGLQTEPESETE